MVHLLIVSLVTLSYWIPLRAQPCERLDIQSKEQQKVLKRFIRECESKGFLTPDSGYIYLSEWVDAQGQTNWQVAALKRWRKYSPIAPFLGHCIDCLAPAGWTKVADRLVLRYNIDHRDTLTKAESGCLQKILAGSVIILPPLDPPPKEVPDTDPKGRPILDKNGKPKMREFTWNVSAGGGGGNNTHITFKKDGSIVKGLSL